MPRILQSLIQSTFGSSEHGNFEAVIVEGGALNHWFRDSLGVRFPWKRALNVVPSGVVWPGSLIQSNFGTGRVRNFEVVVPVRNGGRVELQAFFRNNATETPWQPAGRVTGATDEVAGAPALIQSTFGHSRTGNFEVVVPLQKGPRVELWHFFRDNDDPNLPWKPGARVTGPADDVLWGASLIQSSFGNGNFEVAVPLRRGDRVELWQFVRNADTLVWSQARLISPSVSGPGVLIQGDLGEAEDGNLEAVVPEGNRLVHYFLESQNPTEWRRAQVITESLEGWAALMQSNFGEGKHKNFEVLAEEGGGALTPYWHSNADFARPWLRWGTMIRQPHGARLPDTRKIVQLTGEFDRSAKKPDGSPGWNGQGRAPLAHNQTESRFGIRGTDLGVSFQHTVQGEARTYFLFGDTWRVNQPREIVNFDAIAFTTETNPDAGLRLTFLGQPPVISPSVPQDEFNVPLDGVSVDGAMFVFFSTDSTKIETQPVMGRSILAKSTDGGLHFQQLYEFSRNKFINVSVERRTLAESEARAIGLSSPDVLCIWGSGRYRGSDVYLALLPVAGLATRQGLVYYSGQNGVDRWSGVEQDATPLFPSGSVGELSVRWNPILQRYVLMYNSDNPSAIVMHTARRPWGKWSRAPITVFERFFRPAGQDPEDPCLGAGLGWFLHVPWDWKRCDHMHDDMFDPGHFRENEIGLEYAPYQIAHMAKGTPGEFSDLYFTMSTWNPYQVVLMKTRVTIDLVTTPKDVLLREQTLARQSLSKSSTLAASGQLDAAIREARAAADTLRPLEPAAAAEAEHLFLFAIALHIVAQRTLEAGRVNEALAPAAEAVRVYREAAAATGANVIAIAGQLFTLSHQLSAVASEAAIAPAQAAADVLRGAPAPGTEASHLFHLAAALHAVALRLIGVRRVAEALPPAAESVAAYRRAASVSGANVVAIAGELFNLSARLSSVGQPEAAIAPAQTAADVLRGTPAPGTEATHLFLHATALHATALRLMEARRVKEALQPAADCVSAYRRAAAAPGANILAIGGELFNLSSRLATEGHPEAGVAPAQAAADVLGAPPAPGTEAQHRFSLAVAHHTVAFRFMESHNVASSLAPAKKAVAAYRQAAATQGANVSAIAGQLINLSHALSGNAQPAAAAEAAQAAVDILRDAKPADVAMKSLLAVSLQILALRRRDTGRRDEALQAAKDSLALYRELAAKDPGSFGAQVRALEQLVASLERG